MVVHYTRSKRNKKTNCVEITFAVDVETYANMTRSAERGYFFDTEDYIAAEINTRFQHDRHIPEDEIELMRKYPGMLPHGDIDDDIPF